MAREQGPARVCLWGSSSSRLHPDMRSCVFRIDPPTVSSHCTFQQPGCLAWSDSLTRSLYSSQSLSQQDSCSTHMRPGFSPRLWSPASLQTFPWTKEGAVGGKDAPIRQYPRGPACEKTQESLASNCATSRQEEEVYLWAYQLCKAGQASPRCRGLGGGGLREAAAGHRVLAAHRGLKSMDPDSN